MGLLKKNGITCLGVYQGIQTLLGDGQMIFFDPPISLAELKEVSPDIVAFSCSSSEFQEQLSMAQQVKKTLPDAKIIFGGIHPTIDPESVIRHQAVDIICLGEGEYPMLELCKALENGDDITGIKNLWIKNGDKIIRNNLRPYAENLDELGLDREGIIYWGIYSGRGCKGNCFFCNTPTIKKLGAGGTYFRKRSIENVLDEVDEVIRLYKDTSVPT